MYSNEKIITFSIIFQYSKFFLYFFNFLFFFEVEREFIPRRPSVHYNVTPCYNTFKALGTTEMDLRFSFSYIQAPCHKIYKVVWKKKVKMQVLCQDFGQGNSSSGRSRSRELTKPKDIASYVSSCYEGGQHRFHQPNGSKLTTSSKVIGTLVCIL